MYQKRFYICEPINHKKIEIMSAIKSNVKKDNNHFVVITRHHNADSNIIGKFKEYQSAKICAVERIKSINIWGNLTNITEIFIDGSTKK